MQLKSTASNQSPLEAKQEDSTKEKNTESFKFSELYTLSAEEDLLNSISKISHEANTCKSTPSNKKTSKNENPLKKIEMESQEYSSYYCRDKSKENTENENTNPEALHTRPSASTGPIGSGTGPISNSINFSPIFADPMACSARIFNSYTIPEVIKNKIAEGETQQTKKQTEKTEEAPAAEKKLEVFDEDASAKKIFMHLMCQQHTINALFLQFEQTKDAKAINRIMSIRSLNGLVLKSYESYIQYRKQTKAAGNKEKKEAEKTKKRVQDLEEKAKKAEAKETELNSALEQEKKEAEWAKKSSSLVAESFAMLRNNLHRSETSAAQMKDLLDESVRQNKAMEMSIEEMKSKLSEAEEERNNLAMKNKLLERTIENLEENMRSVENSVSIIQCGETAQDSSISTASFETLLKGSTAHTLSQAHESTHKTEKNKSQSGPGETRAKPNINEQILHTLLFETSNLESAENDGNNEEETIIQTSTDMSCSTDGLNNVNESLLGSQAPKTVKSDTSRIKQAEKKLRNMPLANRDIHKKKEETTAPSEQAHRIAPWPIGKCKYFLRLWQESPNVNPNNQHSFFRIVGLKVRNSSAEVLSNVIGGLVGLDYAHLPLVSPLTKDEIQFALQNKFHKRLVSLLKNLRGFTGNKSIEVIGPLDPLSHEYIPESEVFDIIRNTSIDYIKDDSRKNVGGAYNLCAAISRCATPSEFKKKFTQNDRKTSWSQSDSAKRV